MLKGDLVGLFDLVTGPNVRRKGHGTSLISRLLEWGGAHGADRAYLQVVQSNAPAIHLYEQLGFQSVYEYWYRIPPTTEASSGAPRGERLGGDAGTIRDQV